MNAVQGSAHDREGSEQITEDEGLANKLKLPVSIGKVSEEETETQCAIAYEGLSARVAGKERHPIVTFRDIQSRASATVLPRSDSATASLILTSKQGKTKTSKASKNRSLVLKIKQSTDSYAFVQMSDHSAFLKATRPEMTLFGICIVGNMCPITTANTKRILTLEVAGHKPLDKIEKALSASLKSQYRLDYKFDERSHRPVFVQLRFSDHSAAWDAHALLHNLKLKEGSNNRSLYTSQKSRQSKDVFDFRSVSWIRTKYYRSVAEKAREMELDEKRYSSPSVPIPLSDPPR